MKAFVDTNILLDVLGERQPFYTKSAVVWDLAESGQIDGLIAAVSFTNVFYIARKWGNMNSAREAVILVRDTFKAVSCTAQVINQAIDSEMADFEDAVQYFSALRATADCIVTRNSSDFPRYSAIPILSPEEFLAEWDLETRLE